MNDIRIRPEGTQDIPAIYALNAAAFGREDEAKLPDRLRAHDNLLLSLVAEVNGEVESKVVAHVAFSPARVTVTQSGFDALALGPVAVLPDYQRRGIGTQLIQFGLAECKALGYSLVFLLGHPWYYPRLGFKPAKPLGVRWVGDKSDGGASACEPFMVYELQDGALAHHLDGQAGVFAFAPEFDDL